MTSLTTLALLVKLRNGGVQVKAAAYSNRETGRRILIVTSKKIRIIGLHIQTEEIRMKSRLVRRYSKLDQQTTGDGITSCFGSEFNGSFDRRLGTLRSQLSPEHSFVCLLQNHAHQFHLCLQTSNCVNPPLSNILWCVSIKKAEMWMQSVNLTECVKFVFFNHC
jgi:hypothetical protein